MAYSWLVCISTSLCFGFLEWYLKGNVAKIVGFNCLIVVMAVSRNRCVLII